MSAISKISYPESNPPPLPEEPESVAKINRVVAQWQPVVLEMSLRSRRITEKDKEALEIAFPRNKKLDE